MYHLLIWLINILLTSFPWSVVSTTPRTPTHLLFPILPVDQHLVSPSWNIILRGCSAAELFNYSQGFVWSAVSSFTWGISAKGNTRGLRLPARACDFHLWLDWPWPSILFGFTKPIFPTKREKIYASFLLYVVWNHRFQVWLSSQPIRWFYVWSLESVKRSFVRHVANQTAPEQLSVEPTDARMWRKVK